MKLHIYRVKNVDDRIITTYEIEEHEQLPKLLYLQSIVNGLIEYTQCIFNGKERDMIINEEGLLLGLPFNQLATTYRDRLYYNENYGFHKSHIVGNAIIIEQ